ncbi:MAG: CRISPR-associated protein Cas4 [Euryarchaeota archaeon]|nr:CRISPR-associated protein Cas4 [Euryarchaeota archaeon]
MNLTSHGVERGLHYTGTQVNYYFICKKKLWLFSHNLEMEHSSDLVLLGKLLHEGSYARKFREIMIENIKIDFVEKGCEIHEVKKSRRIEKAHVYQLLYYLYYLKKFEIPARGIINYPLLRKTVEVELTEEKEREMEEILSEIGQILSQGNPPSVEKKSYCKKCSYYELCWS